MPITSLQTSGVPIALQALKEQQKKHKKRAFSGWIVMIIFLMLVSGIIVYIKLMPERFHVMFSRDHLPVKSPANGEVIYVSDKRSVKAGDKLATILVRPGSDAAFESQYRSMYDQRAALERERNNYEMELLKLRENISEKQRQLKLAEVADRQAVEYHDFCVSRAAAAKTAYEKVQRLWNLDAATGSELAAAKSASEKAVFEEMESDSARDRAGLNCRTLQNEIALSETELDRLQKLRQKYFDTQFWNLSKLKEAYSRIRPGANGLEIDILAPVSGWLEERTTPVGSILSRDDIVSVIIRQNSSELVAFVPPRYYTKLPAGSKIDVVLESVRFSTVVKQVRTVLMPLPRGLQNEAKEANKLYLKVDLDESAIPDKSLSWDIGFGTLSQK